MAIDPWIPIEKPEERIVMWAIPEWLNQATFRLEHNPNCANACLVRLIGKGMGALRGDARDAIGYGQTVREAATRALTQR